MKTTRQRIIEFIKVRQMSSAVEIARSLGITAADARHHLAILLSEGVVQISSERKPKGRGRPTRLYALASQVQTHNMDGLASALLEEFLAPMPLEERQEALKRIAKRLSGETGPAGGGLTGRLAGCVQRLDKLGYRARWEARLQGPRLLLEHCPYAAILADHPELCQMDALLLEAMLHTAVTQAARLAPNPHGGRVCIFTAQPEIVSRLSAG